MLISAVKAGAVKRGRHARRLIVPTLRVGMPTWTLRVRYDAERHGMHYHAERGNDHREQAPSHGPYDREQASLIVPPLRVGMPTWTLRVRFDAERHGMHYHAERGNDHREQAPSHGSYDREQASLIVPPLRVGMPTWTLRVRFDAERHGMHYHAERGNDHREQAPSHGSYDREQASLIIPTLRVGMPTWTLRVRFDAERREMHYHAERGNDQSRSTGRRGPV
jgi:hypothetical protein